MPTRFGPLSYSLRRLDAGDAALRCCGGFTGKIVLRPPLDAPLRSVTVDGREFTDFDSSIA
jgi:hypothetical protein